VSSRRARQILRESLPSTSYSMVGTDHPVTIVVPGAARRRGLWLIVPRGKNTSGANDIDDFPHSPKNTTPHHLQSKKMLKRRLGVTLCENDVLWLWQNASESGLVFETPYLEQGMEGVWGRASHVSPSRTYTPVAHDGRPFDTPPYQTGSGVQRG